jgi:hypothetical protein
VSRPEGELAFEGGQNTAREVDLLAKADGVSGSQDDDINQRAANPVVPDDPALGYHR